MIPLDERMSLPSASRAIRVLVVHNRYRSAQPSGENVAVEDEIRLLEQSGCTVSPLHMDSDEVTDWSTIRRGTLPIRVVWSRVGAQRLATAVSDFRPDIVHVHNTFPLLSPSALWSARRAGAAVVHTLHNFRPLCANATLYRDGHACEDCVGRFPHPALLHGCYRDSRLATLPIVGMQLVHRGIGTWVRAVDRLLVPSAFARSIYVRAGWPREKLHVKFNTAPVVESPREGPGRGFVVVSRLSGEKGIDLVVRAWRDAFVGPPPPLSILGSGELESELRILGDSLRVEFAGRVSQVDAFAAMRQARALIFQSNCYEVFPRAIAEAYALGVPVIAPRRGSLAELVEDGRTGLLFEPGSTQDLARAVSELAASDELVIRLGRRARAMFEHRYSPERTTEALLRHYADAARLRKGG